VEGLRRLTKLLTIRAPEQFQFLSKYAKIHGQILRRAKGISETALP
jgi:hypothetical protein